MVSTGKRLDPAHGATAGAGIGAVPGLCRFRCLEPAAARHSRCADDARSGTGPSRQLSRRARFRDGPHQRPTGRGDDAEQSCDGARHRHRQDRYLATLGLCGRVLPLSATPAVLLGDLCHLMLPVEVRIIPTYKIAADLGLIDTYPGLVLPLIASATATLLFRQFFLTIPDELVEAAKIDGAGPWRFLIHMVIPLSRTNIAALFVILFIYGWNQYLWPLLVTNTPTMTTIVIGIRQMIGNGDPQTSWNLVMATAPLALLPPIAVVLAMQRWFVAGLIEPEK